MLRMRTSFSTAPPLLFLLFSFFLDCSLCTAAAASMPPSVAPPVPPPSRFHPADTVEEACHIMVDKYESMLMWYPHCVAALRSNPRSRNATIHELVVLAVEIVLQDAIVELRHMQLLKSRGIGGDPQELWECLTGFDYFIPILRNSLFDLRGDGQVRFQFLFNDIRDFVDCREMQQNPVKKQTEILALLWAIDGICMKYCKYSAPKPCRFW